MLILLALNIKIWVDKISHWFFRYYLGPTIPIFTLDDPNILFSWY